MPKTTLNLRIDSNIKKQAEKVVDELGISMSAAIILYLKAIVRENGIPFDMKVRKPEPVEAPKAKAKKKTKPVLDDDEFELPGSDSIRAAIDKLWFGFKKPLETPQIQRFRLGLANYSRPFPFARVRAFKTAIKKQAIFHACDFIV